MSTEKLQDVDRLLQMLAPAPGETSDRSAYLQRILQVAQSFFSADFYTIAAINPITEEFILPMLFCGDTWDKEQFYSSNPRPNGITRQVLDTGPLLVDDLDKYPQFQTDFTAAESVRSFAALPLIVKEQRKPLAVLYLDYRQPHEFSADECSFLQLLADQAALLLRQIWMYYRYTEVLRIGREINFELDDVSTLFKRLHQLVGPIMDSEHFFMLANYTATTDQIDLYMAEGGRMTVLENRSNAGACRWVLREQQPLFIPHRSAMALDIPAPLVPLRQDDSAEESLIFVPMSIRDVPFGVLTVQSLRAHAYDIDDLQIMQLLGNHVALALSNIRLFESLRQLSETGQLLTQQLNADQVLQNVVEQISIISHADLVLLYPYSASEHAIEIPRAYGTWMQPEEALILTPTQEHVAMLTVQRQTPIFAKQSAMLRALLTDNPEAPQGHFHQREQIQSVVAMPLRVANEPFGALLINFRQPQRFGAPQKHLLQSLGAYAAIAIANARAFDAQVRRRTHELETLQRIDNALARALDLPSTLQTIVDLATRFIRTTRACIYLYDPRRQLLSSHAVTGDSGYQESLTLPLREQRGLIWAAFQHRRPIRVANVLSDPEWSGVYIMINADIRSELDVPLIDDEHVVGVINFESTQEAAFSADDEQFLVILAGQAVIAIKNAQAYERERRLAEERQALIAIGNEITRQLDPQQVFALILAKALELTRSPTGTLMLYDPRSEQLWMAAEQGVLPERKDQSHHISEGVVGYAARARHLINVGDISQPPWDSIHLTYIPDIGSELAVPLLAEDELRGVLNIENPERDHFSGRDERLLTALADLAVIALQNADLYRNAEMRQKRLRALHDVDQRIIGQLDDPDQVIRTVLEHALLLTDAESGDLHLYEGGTPARTYFAQREAGGDIRYDFVSNTDPSRALIQRGIIAYVARAGQPYLTSGDAQADPSYRGEAHIHSEIAMPMISSDQQLVGVLNLESPRFNAFSEDDSQLLELLAGQAVIAIQNARNNLRLRLLGQASRRLAEIADLSEIEQAYAVVAQIGAQIQPHSQISIRRYTPSSQQLVLVYWDRQHQIQPLPYIYVGENLNGIVASIRQPLLVHNEAEQPYGQLLRQLSPLAQSWLGTPIQFGEFYYGNLAITQLEPNTILATDQMLFDGLAQQLAITIQRLEMTQRNRSLQIMGSIGQSASELAHRLGDELGTVPTRIRQIKRELERQGHAEQGISQKLDQVLGDVLRLLNWNKELKNDLRTLQDGQSLVREPRPLDILPIFEQLVADFPSRPAQIGVNIILAPEPPPVLAVERELVDILRNLYKNAIEAMPTGGNILLRANSGESSLEIQICDDGPGIAKSAIESIFDLFYSTKDSSGFGLWSARHYARANGGELTVESQPGRGTTFTLKLPAAPRS